MFVFSVKDMLACDSAVAIVKAVRGIDDAASVYVSLAGQGVEITPASAGASELSDAISGAGFTPVLLESGFVLAGLGRTRGKIPFEGPDRDLCSVEVHLLVAAEQSDLGGKEGRLILVAPTFQPPEGHAVTPHRSPDRAPVLFYVAGMTDDHAIQSVSTAIAKVDAQAKLRIDLAMREVEIVPKSAEAPELRAAIRSVGFCAVRQWPSEVRFFLTDPFFTDRRSGSGDIQARWSPPPESNLLQ